MSKIESLLQTLWDSYRELTPQAEAIHKLLTDRGEQVVNDHIAFRTFDDSRVGIDVIASPFLDAGYLPAGDYEFPAKHLRARHFQHEVPTLPKIFISELKLGEMSSELSDISKSLVDQIPVEAFLDPAFCASGRHWNISHATYAQLADESEYAGWLSAFGYCANHFTVLVNELKTVESLQELNQLLRANGFDLNTDGGEIKGSPEVLLEQSSTLASSVNVTFSDGLFPVPSCYYEFARRYPQSDGTLFQGFVASSADKIFQSTDRRS